MCLLLCNSISNTSNLYLSVPVAAVLVDPDGSVIGDPAPGICEDVDDLESVADCPVLSLGLSVGDSAVPVPGLTPPGCSVIPVPGLSTPVPDLLVGDPGMSVSVPVDPEPVSPVISVPD